MIVAVAVIEIHVHDSQSLKAKRGVVRSICGRLRNKFNVSVAEVGGQGTWQRATIGLSMAGSDEVSLRRALQKAVSFVDDMHLAQVIDSDLEVIRMPLVLSTADMTGDVSGQMGRRTNDEDDLPWNSDLDERDPDGAGTEE